MALYSVERTDRVGPGEFMNALVIAGGTAQARKAVSHMSGVTSSNIRATRVDTTKRTMVLAAYWDEREAESQQDALFPLDEYAGDVSAPESFNW